ncbi:MAG: LytTR family transcriptional regulator [Bacteroidales bacterium]|nr:LytTR family transcriptional regulator [Bacteroidales bacterium]
MNKLPKHIFSSNGFWGHVVGLPLFVLGLLLLFCPFAFKNHDITFNRYSFHIVMIFCIILGVMLISRLILPLINKRSPMTRIQYFLACLFEIVFASGFTGLYLWLFAKKSEAYFVFFGYSMVYLAVAMIIPYIILFLYNQVKEKDELLNDANQAVPSEKIRFLDERGNVKLIVSQTSVLYIQSDENYLRIYYLDDGKINTYLLRSSMKRVEELCTKNGLIRCHRSYFVNKNRVQVLQKDKEFTYAILDVENTAHIPVSKNYYDQISAML